MHAAKGKQRHTHGQSDHLCTGPRRRPVEDEGAIDAPDVLLGGGVHAEMGEVLFQDGEFRGRSCGGGDLVIFCAAVFDDDLETFCHMCSSPSWNVCGIYYVMT